MEKISIKPGEIVKLASTTRDDVQSKAKQLIVELLQNTMQLTKKDVGKWRQAWQMAINTASPKRVELYKIYFDNLADLHLLGAIRQRKLKVLAKTIKVVDRATGETDEELTQLMRARWFKQYCNLYMESIFWGHSLIQFGDLVTKPQLGFTNCTLVPRMHVVPEHGRLVKNATDDWKQGVDYRTKYADWSIEAGDPNDLGLLNPVSPHCISKRNNFAFWDQFSEIFGMPIRIGKTISRDQKDLDKLGSMLENMGSNAWGAFQMGTEIDIKESSRGDAYNVYDRRIERANSEISKGILGVTMTMDNGSSKSQAQVHEDVTDEVAWSDGDNLIDEINDVLFPFLVKHGFKTEGKRAEFDDAYEYTPEEMTAIEEVVLVNYDVDPGYFEDKYGMKILGPKTNGALPTDPDKKAPQKKKHEPTRLMSLLGSAYTACPDCGGHLITLSLTEREIEAEADRIARAIITGDVIEGDIMPEVVQKVAEILRKAMVEGFGKDMPDVKAGTAEATTLQNLETNVYQFSVAKNYQELKEATSLLKDGDRIRSFSEFKKEIVKLHTLYNRDWLNTEYNTAIASAQSAANWLSYQDGKEDMPLLQYKTVGDARVRESHKSMDGVKRPIDDAFWNTHYPPNGWNCRCTTVQTSGKETPENKIKYAKVEPMFLTNMAKDGVIFPKSHPYWDGVPEEVLAKAEDLKPKK